MSSSQETAKRRIDSEATVVPKTRVRWKIFFLLLGLVTVNYVDRASISIAMPLISKEFAIGPTIEGLLLAAFFWPYAAMQIPGGMLADRFLPRVVITASTIIWGLFEVLCAAATGWVLMLIARLGLGAAEAPIYPAGNKLIALWLTSKERSRGAALLDGGAPLGAALGSIIIAWLIALFGDWRPSFVIAGIGTVLFGLWAWHYIRNSPRTHSGVNEAEARHIEDAQAAEDTLTEGAPRHNLWQFFIYRSVWAMCIGWFFFNTVWYGLLTWMPSYLFHARGLDIRQLGSASFFIFFVGFIGEQVGGQLGDLWRRHGGNPNLVYRTLFGVAAVLTTVSIFLVAYVADPITAVILLASTVFFLRWCGMYWVIPSYLTTRDRVGFLGGWMNMGGNFAGFSVALIVGAIVQVTGSYFMSLMYFAVAGVGLLICSLLINYNKKLPV